MTAELQIRDFAEWTPDQLKLITNTVARGASADELRLFLYRCKNLKLDPLKSGQIHFIKYGSGPGTIVIGIDGFRSIAARTGKLAGIKRGVIKDAEGKLTGAWAEVYRHDWKEPAKEEVPFAEYNKGRGTWAAMPETMIKKVAEAAALRMAFPDDLGGVYATEEMDQATPKNPVFADQPGAHDGVRPTGFRFSISGFKGRSLEEIKLADLRAWIETVDDRVTKTGKSLDPEWTVDYNKAKEYIDYCDSNEETFDDFKK